MYLILALINVFLQRPGGGNIGLKAVVLALLTMVVVFSIMRYFKARALKNDLLEAHRFLLGYSLAEEEYLKKVVELEKGERTRKEIKDEIRKSVLEDNTSVRFPEFASEQMLKNIKKKINKL